MSDRVELRTLTPGGSEMATLRAAVIEDQRPATEPRQHMLFSGDPVEDMESAKALIRKHPNVDLDLLMSIAADRTQPLSSRIAAVYTLGFTDDNGKSKALLSQLINDASELPEVKDHADEALGYISGH